MNKYRLEINKLIEVVSKKIQTEKSINKICKSKFLKLLTIVSK